MTITNRNISRKRKRFQFVSAMSFALVAAIISIYIYANYASSDIINVRYQVSGTKLLSEDEIRAMLRKYNNTSYSDIDLYKIKKDFETVPVVESVLVAKELPGIVKVVVSERMPFACIVSSCNYNIIVDKCGFVMPESSTYNYNIPIITNSNKYYKIDINNIQNSNIYRNILALLRESARYKNTYDRISEVHISGNNDIEIYMIDSPAPVLFRNVANGIEQLSCYNYYYKHEDDGYLTGNVLSVDVRFRNQIVVNRCPVKTNEKLENEAIQTTVTSAQ